MIARWWRRLRRGGDDPARLAQHALRLLTLPRDAAAPVGPCDASSQVPAGTALTPEELAAIRVMLRARELLRARSGVTPAPAAATEHD